MKYMLKLNLQTFADDLTADPLEKQEVTFTPEQQAKIDALIAKTIARERAKAEADYVKARDEALRLAGLTTDQMVEYELQQHEKSLAQREAEISRRELRADAVEQLAEKRLPKELAGILVYTSKEEYQASLQSVEEAYRTDLERNINKRLKGVTPGGNGSHGSFINNPWKKGSINLTEQGRILRRDPSLARQMKLAAGIKP